MSNNHNSNSAATDVAEFLTDLDGGQFDHTQAMRLGFFMEQ